MRLSRLYFFAVALVLAFSFNFSFAAGRIVAKQYSFTRNIGPDTPTFTAATCSGAISQYVSAYNAYFSGSFLHNNISVTSCTAYDCEILSKDDNNPSGSVGYLGCTPFCPVGATGINETQCQFPDEPDCPAGEYRDASGQCQKDCSNHQGLTAGGGVFEYGSQNSHYTTVNGCEVHCPESVCFDLICAGYKCKYTGRTGNTNDSPYIGPTSAPDPNRKPPENPSDCGVKGMGYIQSSNGTITCVPSVESPNGSPTVGSESGTSSGSSGDDGSADPDSSDFKKEESSSETKDGSTTTRSKTTENPDPEKNGTENNGCAKGASLVDGKCVSEKVTVEDTSSFCQKNPLSAVCKPYKDECIENPNRVGCSKLGTPETPVDPKKSEFSMGGLVPVNFSGGGSCPPDVTIRGATFSYGKLCEGLGFLRPIVIALAWIAAAYIVFGSVKGS